MSNREKLINLQRRFEKDTRYYADKEDYTSFEKAIEDFIVEAGRLNPDINTKDLLKIYLSKASKIKNYSDALQIMNSVSSDITVLSMDLHGKGEPIFVASEYDKLRRDNSIEYAKNRFEVFKKSFDLLKKNNSDRFSKIDDLRSLYLGNVKNYKDKVFKFPHLVDTEQRKLFNTLKDIITKQVFDTFEKDREILLSYLSEIAEIGKAYVDRNIDFNDRLLDGYHIQKRREVIGESVDTEKLRRNLDKSNEKNIDSLTHSIKKCFESYIKGVENLMTEHSKLYNDRIERTRAERIILGGQDEVKGIIERYKKQLEDIITSGLSKDEEIFYSIMDKLENSINESDESTNLYEVSGEFEYDIKFNFDRLRDDVLDDITNWWQKIEFGNKLILKKYLRSGMGDQFDLFIKRKYRRLKPNEIGLSQVIEFVKGEYEAYSMEFNNMVVEILNGYDVTYSRYNKFKDISDTARKLAKDFQKEKWVYRSFFVKHNNMIEECIEDFLSAYQKGDYHDERWSYPYDDWYKDRNFYRVVEVELSNAYYRSVKDHEVSERFRYKGYSTVMDESDSISESRRDTFFEAEEDKKPKISKEEKEKLKAQLDNFFADKKEAKATELKKSIADRDKAIEDVILKYSTEKEKIQREYSKNIQAAKSEAEANKLRAERNEELQRLSLEKATSIEDLKERQKKEEASIREKYQTLFDKKLEEYKDSLGDTISDFAKDIERGIEDGIKSNPIFQ